MNLLTCSTRHNFYCFTKTW